MYAKELESPEHAKNASNNAYTVAAMYAATCMFSMFMYVHRSKQEQSKEKADARTSPESDAINTPLVQTSSATNSDVAIKPALPKKKSGKNNQVSNI